MRTTLDSSGTLEDLGRFWDDSIVLDQSAKITRQRGKEQKWSEGK